jgi:hypothetical protein
MKRRPASEVPTPGNRRRKPRPGAERRDAVAGSVDDASLRALARALLALAEELIEREEKQG